MTASDTIDLDAIFRVLADRLDCSCVEEAEYLGQRRWFADLLAEADTTTLSTRKDHADDQLMHLRKLASNLGKALDALDAIDPAASVWLAAQSGLSELSLPEGLANKRPASRLPLNNRTLSPPTPQHCRASGGRHKVALTGRRGFSP